MLPMATTDPTTMTPVEIDTVLYENYEARLNLHMQLAYATKTLARLNEWLAKAEGARAEVLTRDLAEAQAHEKELLVSYADLVEAANPFYAEFDRRGGWNRYFLVKNANGHVHRGTDCNTCFPSTVYGWLVDLADCNEDAMIEEWGERACTVCFPSAPTNPLFNRPARVDREAQAAREAEKTAKDAAKAEKAITDVDGSPLKIGTEVFRTKVAARNELSSQVQNGVWYGPNANAIHKLVDALLAAGIDWAPVALRAFKKAKKEAVMDPSNPYRLTPEQIAETEAKITANIAATNALLTGLIGKVDY